MRVDVPEYNTFIDFPDNTPPEEIQMAMEKNFPSKIQVEAKPTGFGGDVANLGQKFEDIRGNMNRALGERGSNLYDVMQTGTIPEKAGRFVGQQVAAAGDVVGEGIKGLFDLLTPDSMKQNISQSMKTAMQDKSVQAGLNVLQGIQGKYGEARKEYPNAMYDIEALTNLVTGGLAGKLGAKAIPTIASDIGKAGQAVSGVVNPIVKEPFKLLGDIGSMAKGKSPEALNTEAEKIVTEYLPKAIRPSNKNLTTATQTGEGYYKKTTPSFVDTVVNKNATDAEGNKLLELFDKKGNPIELPQSVSDDLQAVKVGKQKWWERATQLREEASGMGSTLDVKPILIKLDDAEIKISKSGLPGREPAKNAILQAKQNLAQYIESGMPLKQAQADLSELNNKLFGKGVSVNYDTYGMKEIDSFLATQYRKGLDDSVIKATGNEDFQQAKKMFGSYKTREEDTMRMANQLSKKSDYDLFNESDIWIGYHGTASLLMGNIPGIIASGLSLAEKKILKGLSEPDSKIKSMYKQIDKLVTQSERANNPQSETMKSLQKIRNYEIPAQQGYKIRGEARKRPTLPVDWEEQTRGLPPQKRK